jgi:hypothetical protein
MLLMQKLWMICLSLLKTYELNLLCFLFSDYEYSYVFEMSCYRATMFSPLVRNIEAGARYSYAEKYEPGTEDYRRDAIDSDWRTGDEVQLANS